MLTFTWVVSTLLLFDFFLAARHGLRDLGPQPGIKPVLLRWKHGVLTTQTPGTSFFFLFYSSVISHRLPLLADLGSVYIYIYFFFPK